MSKKSPEGARRNTRELILQTSLALFNDQGEPNVSTNEIALEADISPGNLYYHFRHRDEIALELFKRYLVELSPLLEPIEGDQAPGIEELYLRLHLLFETMGRYRFVHRDLAELCTRIDRLRPAIVGLLGRQEAALYHLVGRLRDAEVMSISPEDEAALVNNTLQQMTFWIAWAEIRDTAGLADGSALTAAAARVLYLFIPYLANAEAEQFRELAREYMGA